MNAREIYEASVRLKRPRLSSCAGQACVECKSVNSETLREKEKFWVEVESFIWKSRKEKFLDFDFEFKSQQISQSWDEKFLIETAAAWENRSIQRNCWAVGLLVMTFWGKFRAIWFIKVFHQIEKLRITQRCSEANRDLFSLAVAFIFLALCLRIASSQFASELCWVKFSRFNIYWKIFTAKILDRVEIALHKVFVCCFKAPLLNHRHHHPTSSASSVATETQHEPNFKSCAVIEHERFMNILTLCSSSKTFSVSFESSVELEHWLHSFAFTWLPEICIVKVSFWRSKL